MAEQFLTLMADLEENAQARMAQWYDELRKAGFIGAQTPGLPYHISLATFPLDQEREAADLTERVAAAFSPFPVHFSHMGLFAGGKVLFAAPERTPQLDALHEACDRGGEARFPWTPHATLLIDAPERVCAAVPILVSCFQPFVAEITRLHLCAFWPMREIASAALRTKRE